MSVLDLADGLHLDFPAGMYHQRILGVASKGALDIINRSPAHYATWVGGVDREPTDALAFGCAFHAATLEPVHFANAYVVEPTFGDCRKTENKANRDAWRKENTGKIAITAADMKAIHGMRTSLLTHPIASRMLSGGVSEVTLRWTDTETGLVCKARADYHVEELDMVVDLKTTEDARPHAFRRSVAAFRYHVQQAFYSDGFAALGAPLRSFAFVAVEKVPPYAVAVYLLDTEAVTKGWAAARENLTTLARCIEAGDFPAYDNGIQTLDLPAWA